MAITITKSELTRQVKEKVGNVPHLNIVIGAVFEAVAENLVEGNDVRTCLKSSQNKCEQCKNSHLLGS